jgi:hypothetical protein
MKQEYNKVHIETIIRQLYNKGVVNCKPFHGTYGETSTGTYPSTASDFNEMMSPESEFTYLFFGTMNVNILVNTGGSVAINCTRPFGAESTVSEFITQFNSTAGNEGFNHTSKKVLINTIEITPDLGTGVITLDGYIIKITP